MGKNFQGGNKHKSYANKNMNHDNEHIRFVQDTDEKYAIVTKILGAGMFLVTYLEKHDEQLTKSVLAHIRGNMKGKQKRNNIVALHSLVLIGLRAFETNIKNADILHVYSNANANLLREQFQHINLIHTE
tara:strand:+ start:138 stop:527 length:390 start_codon:yes stop_codon:yes gene_type:complete